MQFPARRSLQCAGQSVSRGHSPSSSFAASVPRRNPDGSPPANLASAAATNKWKQTKCDSGLPGNPKAIRIPVGRGCQQASSGAGPAIDAENQRPARPDVHLAENDFKSEPFQQWPGEILFTHTRAAGNQQHVRIADCRLPIADCRFCQLEIFRQMRCSRWQGNFCSRLRIKIELLSRIWPGCGCPVRRNNFIAGGEMADPQSRADERLRATHRCQQRQGPGVKFHARLQNRFTCPHFFPPAANIRGVLPAKNSYLVAGAFDIFLHDHRKFSHGKAAPGNPDGFPGFQFAAVSNRRRASVSTTRKISEPSFCKIA